MYSYAQKTEIIYYTPDIVRVVKSPTDNLAEHHSMVVKAKPQTTGKKNVIVTKDSDGRLTFSDSKGNVLLREGSHSAEQNTNGADKVHGV